MNPKFTQAIILGKDCQWTILTARLTMRSDDKPCLRWLASSCLVSRSHSFPRNCNRAKKQRLLQSFIFISTITSWDYGYQFWATETTVSAESEGLRFDSSWGLRSFSFSLARDKKKNIFLYFFTELKTYHLSYSNYKHDAIDVANPSSMQDACHMNFVIDFANRRVSVV